MPEKRTPIYWVLNIFSTLLLFGWFNVYFATLFIRIHGSAPQHFGLLKGPLWPLEFVVGKPFPLLFFIIPGLLGLITAIRYRSYWGAVVASVAATLTLLHILANACGG